MLYLFIFLLLGAALLAQAAAPSSIDGIRLAYLYKSKDQTSCMAAVIDMRAAFVAANCIDLTSDNEVDTSVSYRIQYTPTSTNNQTGPIYALVPDRITIHPNYNSTTLENNIAIVQYNDGSTDDYVGYIGSKEYIGGTKVYARRDYDISTFSWNTLQISNQFSNDDACVDGSSLYSENKYWMTCTGVTTTSSANSDCSIPYGVMYKQNSSDIIALTSIYSHSVIYGNDLCTKYVKILNYYTVLWPYLGFAVSSLGRGVNIYNQTKMSLTTNTTILSMVPPKSASVPNVTVEGGDLYPKQREIEGSTSVSETDGASEPTNGLSKGQKIGIGVGVSLGAILVIIGCIIVYHIWNVKRQDKAWDPNAEALNLQDIAFDIAADDRLLVPPPYSQVNNEAGSNSRQPRETTDTKRR